MSDILQMAKSSLLTPLDIDENHLQKTLHTMLSSQIDFAELYLQNKLSENWFFEDDIVKSSSFNADQGVGVRAISGEKTGYAYANDIHLQSLESAASAARSIAKQGSNQKIEAWKTNAPHHSLYSSKNPLNSASATDKVSFLKQVNDYIRQLDSRIKRATINLSASHEAILILNNLGTFAADLRPLVHLSISVIIEEKGRTEQGYFGCGGRENYSFFWDNDGWKKSADEAVRLAQVNLQAIPAPAGTMPVILGSGWNGVLLHEAVGHGLEGDMNRKKNSVYSGRINEVVVSPLCTIVDDGTIAKRRGSLNIDDEGIPTQKTVLIENGVLKQYMQDQLNAKLMNVKSTGNGRRESYAFSPIPRMTNTYMLPGEHIPEDIIKSVDHGLYVANMGGGQVDITSGKFVFSASEAYLIKNGKKTSPVKGATLIGNGPEAMTKVSMVGNDLDLDPGVGMCGKAGQSIPVGVGQPTLKIDELTVGGTAI